MTLPINQNFENLNRLNSLLKKVEDRLVEYGSCVGFNVKSQEFPGARFQVSVETGKELYYTDKATLPKPMSQWSVRVKLLFVENLVEFERHLIATSNKNVIDAISKLESALAEQLSKQIS